MPRTHWVTTREQLLFDVLPYVMPAKGTVKLSHTRLSHPQDDGLEFRREQGMLGVGQSDSA